MVKVNPIHTEEDYNNTLKRIRQIFQAEPGTSEGDELEVLATLAAAYEDKNYTIEAPDPVEAIKFQMEQLNLRPKDLTKVIGDKSTVSKILKRQRKLNLAMIRKLHNVYNIPLRSLVKSY